VGSLLLLDEKLLNVKSRKRRREHFKEFVTPLIENYAASIGTSGQLSEVFGKKITAVLDIRARIAKSAQSAPAAASLAAGHGYEEFNLSNLFNDDDDL